MFEREKNILKHELGTKYDILKAHNVILAGGAITSIFTENPINDFDLYFRDAESVYKFYTEGVIARYIFVPQYLTHNAVTLTSCNSPHIFQMVCCGLFEEPKDIFDSFDFTLNMGAYDFKTEEFVLHPEFMLHNAQRKISINQNTKYPMASLTRVQKYLDRGYSMSRLEWFRMAIMLRTLNINSWNEFEDGLSGLYGENIHVANSDDNTPFSWEEAMNRINELCNGEIPDHPTQSTPFAQLNPVAQLRLVMASFNCKVNCTLLATNRNDRHALNKLAILQDEYGRIFPQNIDDTFDSWNITESTPDVYPIDVFKVVKKDESGRMYTRHNEFVFEPGRIVDANLTYLAAFDAYSINTNTVNDSSDRRVKNVILHLQINSPDWFAFTRDNTSAIWLKKALVIGDISLNEFNAIFKTQQSNTQSHSLLVSTHEGEDLFF